MIPFVGHIEKPTLESTDFRRMLSIPEACATRADIAAAGRLCEESNWSGTRNWRATPQSTCFRQRALSLHAGSSPRECVPAAVRRSDLT